MKARDSGALAFGVGTLVIALIVVAVGLLVLGREALADLLAGTAVAIAVQLAVFLAFFIWMLPDRPGVAYSIGVLVRLIAVGVMAFLGVAAFGLDAAPALLSMVGYLFGSTLLEALFLHRREMARVVPGVPTMR